MEALQAYTKSTDNVLGYITNQLSSVGLWQNVTGVLTKVSSSSGGYVWGYNSQRSVYMCKEPCSGWTQIAAPSNIIDIATDNISVYILYDNKWASRPIDGSGGWTEYECPFQADKFVTTNGFLWISGSGKTAFCGKPCTTGNWNVREDTHSLLSGGGTNVFATVPGELGVVKTDETSQTGWKPVGGLEGIAASTFSGEADNTVLYAGDSKRLYRCEGTCESKDQLKAISTQGYLPIQDKGSISVNPTTHNVWMASSTSANGGNLFERLDAPSVDPILSYVDEVEQQRDNTFNSLGGAYEVQTANVASKIAQGEAAQAIKRTVNLTGRKDALDNKISLLQRDIEDTKNTGGGYTEKMDVLYVLLVSLSVVVLLYLVASWFLPSGILMTLVVLVVSVGFGLAIYFSIHNNGTGSS